VFFQVSPGFRPYQITSRGLSRSFGTIGPFTSSATKDRNRIDLSNKDVARHWCKRLKKSRAEIEAAIAKVGDNAQTVMKDLGSREP
jgi:hypothetical protein